MKSVSKMALAVALSLGAFASLTVSPAVAQQAQPGNDPAPADVQLSDAERAALVPLEEAFLAGNYPQAQALLPAATAAAKGNDAKFYVGQYRYQIGLKVNDLAMQADGLTEMLQSGKLSQDRAATAYSQIGVIAYNNLRDFPRAEYAFGELVKLAPDNPEALANLARIKRDLKKPDEARPLLERAIAAQKAAGQKPSENWLKLALDMAYTGRSPTAIGVGRDLVAAYPTAQNWRDVLTIYRELGNLDSDTTIDAYRLMRAAKALNGERDYLLFADSLNRKGFPAETKAVLDEGVANRMLDANDAEVKSFLSAASARVREERASLAGDERDALAAGDGKLALAMGDVYYGYGEYAKAATLYQAALQKGSIDANVANTRLGAALAMAGRKAEAEAAFRAVTGPRADLAAFWLTWLGTRA